MVDTLSKRDECIELGISLLIKTLPSLLAFAQASVPFLRASLLFFATLARTYAVTGLRIINGGGKAEVQAAHIWSVADGGPDVVPNGVALSATAHWLFDRHLISFDENL